MGYQPYQPQQIVSAKSIRNLQLTTAFVVPIIIPSRSEATKNAAGKRSARTVRRRRHSSNDAFASSPFKKSLRPAFRTRRIDKRRRRHKRKSRRKPQKTFELDLLPLLFNQKAALEPLAALVPKYQQQKEVTPESFDLPTTSPLFQPFLKWMEQQSPEHQNQIKVHFSADTNCNI